VLVAVDDNVAKDQGLVTLESGACTGPASAGPASVETRDATAWGGPPSWAARDMRMAARLVVPSTGSHPLRPWWERRAHRREIRCSRLA